MYTRKKGGGELAQMFFLSCASKITGIKSYSTKLWGSQTLFHDIMHPLFKIGSPPGH